MGKIIPLILAYICVFGLSGHAATPIDSSIQYGDTTKPGASPLTACPTGQTCSCPVGASLVIKATATTVCSTGSITFSISSGPATSGFIPVYSWYHNGTEAQNGGSATYTAASWANGDQVYCKLQLSRVGCSTLTETSNTITITVTPAPSTPSSPSGNLTPCEGATATYTTSASNVTSYNWTVNGSAVAGTGASNAITLPAGVSGAAAIGVSATGCGTSSVATTSIAIGPSVASPNAPSGSTPICIASSPLTYTTSAVANATGYIWSITPTAAGTISGSGTSGVVAWSPSFTGSAAVGVASTGCNASTTPVTETVVVNGLVGTPSAPSGPTAVNNSNGPSTFTATAAYASGYNWSISPSSAGSVAATGNTAVVTWNLLYAGSASIQVSANGCSGPSATATTTVTVYFPLTGGDISPSWLNINSGSDPGLLTASSATGGNCGGSYSYQWEVSANGVNFSIATGSSAAETYDPGVLTATTYFRRRVNCGSDSALSGVSTITVGSSSAIDLNYIRARVMSRPGVTDTVTADGLTSPYDVRQTTQYYDGLGRPVQTVAMQETPLQNDMVLPQVYDNFGRESTRYLSYSAATNDGNYKPTAISDQSNFNAAQYPNEQYYYSQITYEASLLNRALESYAPGISWVGSGRGASLQYLINTAADSVQLWSISSVQLSLPVDNGAYQAGQLFKSVQADENGNQEIVYKDKMGKTILKKTQASASPSTGHAGWLCTYYIYDTLQNLRFVMQPEAVALIDGSWAVSQGIANGLCFRYEYDGRRRMIIKRTPGAGEVWMVYDARNRMVMEQDSALHALEKWAFVKYDTENRQDSAGFITDPSNYNYPAYHDSLAYYSTNYPVVSNYTNELLTMNFYDDYSWISTYGAPLSANMATSYTSNSNYFITSYNTSPSYAVAVTPFAVNRGMSTGSMKKVVGTASQYLYSASFYDDRGRPIQSQSVNYTGAIDTITIQYNFNGEVLRTLLNHKKNGNTVQSHIVLTKMDYDQSFRLRHIWKNIDQAANDQLIDSLQYNELGQLRAKYLGNSVDSLIYDYNIRGWLTGINKNYVAGTTNHYFGMELGYDKTSSVAPGNTYVTPEYNGNIEGAVWKSAGSGVNRKYDYAYDNDNRLLAANFNQYNGSGFDKSAGIDYSVNNLSYDANGNLLTMEQKGFTVGGSSFIDQLKYKYQPNSNQLSQVYDTANNPTSLLGDFHWSGTKDSTDYNYDVNGNLIQDNNRGISSITYNYLNLPQLIHINGKGNIGYTYDAGGARLLKVITDSMANRSTTILYISGFVYQQTDTIISADAGADTLQFIAHEEGRIRWAYHKYTTGTTAYKFEYDFFEKDHLGNTRMVLTQERDTTNYLATMEPQYRATEVQLFGNITTTSYAWNAVPNYQSIPSAQMTLYTNPNDSVSKVDSSSGGGQKTGPSLLLKVMSGDTVNLSVQCFYNSGTGGTINNSFNNVLNSLANGLVTATGAAHGTLGNLTASNSSVYTGLTSFMNNDDTAHNGYPKAYINYIFLDDQFNYVSSMSGSVLAASSTYPAGQLNLVGLGSPLALNRNGYLYIWVSNETQGWDVFFDNLSAQYKQGPVLEENHYYPFGLTQAGISDKAIKTQYAENKYRYDGGNELQNKEFSDGTGLELYETSFRSYDQQVGRFFQEDPMANQTPSLSTYQFAADNPTLMNDPTGLMPNKMNPAYNATVTYNGGFTDGTGVMNSVMAGWAGEGDGGYGTAGEGSNGGGPGGGSGGGSGGGGSLNAAGSPGTLIYQAGASGNLGNFASAYVALGNILGTPISSTDSYLAAMIFNSSWCGQVSNVTATLLPNGKFQINGTTQDGTALNNYQVGSDYVSSYLSGLSGYEGESNGGEESNGMFDGEAPSDKGGVWNSFINGLRLPDYVSFNFSIGYVGGWNLSAALDRYGHLYVSPYGGGVSYPFGAGASLTANWLQQNTTPSASELNNFLTGNSVSYTAGGLPVAYFVGVQSTVAPETGQSATGIGFMTPQIGASWNYQPSESLIFNTFLKW